jgi:hypothetical protein
VFPATIVSNCIALIALISFAPYAGRCRFAFSFHYIDSHTITQSLLESYRSHPSGYLAGGMSSGLTGDVSLVNLNAILCCQQIIPGKSYKGKRLEL